MCVSLCFTFRVFHSTHFYFILFYLFLSFMFSVKRYENPYFYIVLFMIFVFCVSNFYVHLSYFLLLLILSFFLLFFGIVLVQPRRNQYSYDFLQKKNRDSKIKFCLKISVFVVYHKWFFLDAIFFLSSVHCPNRFS